MIDLELEAPEVDADEEAPAFNRRLALAVVFVTLIGAIVAFLQTAESIREDNAAGDAVREAVLGLGNQLAESADETADGDIVTVDVRLSAQEAAAQRQLERVGFEEAQAAAAAAAADQAAAARAAIAGQPALVGETPGEAARIVRDDDPIFARLSQGVSADSANAHGAKADTYVAILTVLAAALFLLGLSLTVSERLRFFLVVPGLALAGVAVVWTVVVSQREVRAIRESAIELTAVGQRLQDLDLDGAIDAYDEAIDRSPEFGPAFAGRAAATFALESPQLGEADVISITDPDTAEDVIDDLERAIDLGEDDNADVLSFAGYVQAVYGDPDRGVELATEASQLSRDDAEIRFNRGVAEAAAGLDDAAERSYRRALQLVEREPVFSQVLSLLSSARSDLSALVHERPGDVDDRTVETIGGQLAAFEAEFRLRDGFCDGCRPPGEGVGGDAEATAFEFSTDGFFARVDFDVAEVPSDAPVTVVWFTRQIGADTPYQQVAFPDTVDVEPADDGVIASIARLRSSGCPEPAEVRVEVYAGQQLLGVAEGEIPPNPLGADLVAHVDEARGITACVPAGFTVADREGLDGRDFNTVELVNESTGISVLVFKAIGSDASGLSLDERIALADERLEEFADGGEIGDIQDGLLFAESADGREFLEGSSALISGTDDADGPTAVAVDANGVFYSVNVIGSEDMDLLLAAIDLVVFTGLDPDAAPD